MLDLESHVDHYLHRPVNVLSHTTSVKEAIKQVREGLTDPNIHYFYVLGNNGMLSGIVSAHHLLRSGLEANVGDIMEKHVISVQKEAPLKSALQALAEHHFSSIPIVDDKGHLHGVIELDPHEKSSAVLRRQSKRDIYQLIGLSLDQTRSDTFIQDYAQRMPWLIGNIFAGLMCAAIASYFRLVLDEIVVLAMFIPLVLTLSESIAMQSLTLNLVFLHHNRIPWKLFFSRIVREWKTTALLGLSACILVGSVYLFIQGDVLTMASIVISIFASMFLSATVGIILPLAIHKMKLDPKVAAGPVVLMAADMMGTSIYLSLATWLLLNS